MPEPLRWQVIVERAAEKRMERLPRDVRRRLDAALQRLEENPRHPGVIQLSGHANLYRVRVGDWRIIFTIRDAQLIVIVVEVDARGSVYRQL
jgi:mRNA interferase RelE/StbE